MGLYEFGILISTMHMDWMRVVAGRLKNDYSYSPNVYHLFPFPSSDNNKETIEKRVKAILKIRESELEENGSSLADLYDPDGMSTELRKAHKALDRAVEKCYRKERFKGVMDRLIYLFSRYTELTSPVINPKT